MNMIHCYQNSMANIHLLPSDIHTHKGYLQWKYGWIKQSNRPTCKCSHPVRGLCCLLLYWHHIPSVDPTDWMWWNVFHYKCLKPLVMGFGNAEEVTRILLYAINQNYCFSYSNRFFPSYHPVTGNRANHCITFTLHLQDSALVLCRHCQWR